MTTTGRSERSARTASAPVPAALAGVATALLLAVALGASVGAVLVGGSATPPVAGLPDPGALVRWGQAPVRVVLDLSAAATIGLLVLAAVAVQPSSGRANPLLEGARLKAVRAAGAAGILWVASGTTSLVLTYADIVGLAPGQPGFDAGFADFVGSLELGRSLTASLVLAAVAATGAVLATRSSTTGPLAVLAILALFPVALTGHSAGSTDHEVAVNALFAHLVGVSVWVGGLLGVVLLARALGPALPVTVRRFSGLAGFSFALVAVSGAVSAWVRLGGVEGLGSRYGVLVAAKVAALVVLGGAGYWWRRVALDALETGTGRNPLARLAVGELVVMGAAVGVASALARTAPPVPDAPATSAAESLLGVQLPPELTTWSYLTVWRVDTLWLTVALLGAGWYLWSVRRLARRGDSWPVGRTIVWVLGLAILVWATSSGPGAYGRVLFSAHMLGHMTVSMVVPPLLVLGAPVTLAMRALPGRRDGSQGPREWLLALVHSRALTLLSHPVVAATLFAGSLVVFYYSPLLELALRTHTGHVLMHLHFLLAGYLFASVLVGVDPGPRRPAYPLRLVMLFATLSFHAFFGVAIVQGSTLLAPDWFEAMPRYGERTALADQQYGGALAWGVGELPTVLLALGVALSWVRSDERDARRSDRKADRDGGAELAAYNARLTEMARRSAPPAREEPRRDRLDP